MQGRRDRALAAVAGRGRLPLAAGAAHAPTPHDPAGPIHDRRGSRRRRDRARVVGGPDRPRARRSWLRTGRGPRIAPRARDRAGRRRAAAPRRRSAGRAAAGDAGGAGPAGERARGLRRRPRRAPLRGGRRLPIRSGSARAHARGVHARRGPDARCVSRAAQSARQARQCDPARPQQRAAARLRVHRRRALPADAQLPGGVPRQDHHGSRSSRPPPPWTARRRRRGCPVAIAAARIG